MTKLKNNSTVYIFYKKGKKIQLIRPAIALNRFEILKLASFWQLPIYVDYTNKLISFRRNRLRHQIFPILRVFFNPKIDKAFFRFIETVIFEKNYFNQQLNETKNFFRIQRIESSNLRVEQLKIKKFLIYLPENLQKKFYRQFLIVFFKNITFNEIESLLRLNLFNTK